MLTFIYYFTENKNQISIFCIAFKRILNKKLDFKSYLIVFIIFHCYSKKQYCICKKKIFFTMNS